jgi:hypothetical protein
MELLIFLVAVMVILGGKRIGRFVQSVLVSIVTSLVLYAFKVEISQYLLGFLKDALPSFLTGMNG